VIIVDSETEQLKQAIDKNDLKRVKELMTRNPELHRAPLGYAKDGPLTWVAECRVPWEPPGETRLAMARWMIENGSDVHQGGDGPLSRAALYGLRAPMMELLVSMGADVNAAWHNYSPVIHGPCETLDPTALRWLLKHGADPDCGDDAQWAARGKPHPGTALDYLLGTYVRDPETLGECVEVLLEAGGGTKYRVPGLLQMLRGHLDEFEAEVAADSELVHRQFPGLDIGTTGGRMLTLRGATLLHAAAEFGVLEAAEMVLDRGADVNAKASIDEAGVGGQTPLFHAVTQREDAGLPLARLLIERGADLTVRAKLPGYYERPGEVVECTPLGYALLFPGGVNKTVKLLRAHGAPE
jgi:ankyrin repeat protein